MNLTGLERVSGTAVTVRDFSTKSLAIESTARIAPNQLLEIDLQHDDQTFTVRGMPTRSDRVPGRAGAPLWLTAVEVRCATPQERSQFESFLWLVPRSARQT